MLIKRTWLVTAMLAAASLSCKPQTKDPSRGKYNKEDLSGVATDFQSITTFSYEDKLALFRASTQRDSVLVIKLLSEFENFNIEEHSWDYEIYDRRYKSIRPLLESLLSEKKDGELMLNSIDNNLLALLDYYRDGVIDDFEEYRVLTSEIFIFLRKRSDSVAYVLSKRAISDSLVSEKQRGFAYETLAEYYSDWQ